MRGWLVALVLVAGCADSTAPAPRVTLGGRDLEDVLSRATEVGSAATPDVCALAAELPSDNICSLVCDPDAIAARLVAQGATVGTCYELRCELPGLAVNVGVCLPPAPP